MKITNDTFTDDSTVSLGTAGISVFTGFAASTLAATNAITTTDAATVYIAGQPVAGTNQTISNAWSLLINDGNTKLNSTTSSSDTSTGALQISGGVGIIENLNVGGTLTVGGTSVTGGLTEGTFVAANNQTAVSVTGLLFTSQAVRIFLNVVIDTTVSDFYEFFEINVIRKNTTSTFAIFSSSFGDTSGVTFAVTAGGQVTYSSTNQANFTSSTFTWKLIEIV